MEREEKTIHVHYYAALRDQRGIAEEALQTTAETAHELYCKLKEEHSLQLPLQALKVAINNKFAQWETHLNQNDIVVFIPPVSGG